MAIKESFASIKGLFDYVNIKSVYCNLLFTEFTCLKDIVVTDQSVSGGHGINEFKNVYIGGKARFTRCNVAFIVRLDNSTNKYALINELEFSENLRWIECKALQWESAIYINKLLFNNIYISKDSSWTLQGLRCHEIVFNYFRNAGVGDIATTYGAKFMPSGRSFENFHKRLLDKTIFEAYKELDYDLTGDNGNLTLNYSDLGKINFIDDDFSHFTLNFNSTKLSEIYLAGSKLPKIVKASDLGGLPESLRHQERIANSQLKKLHEQHGDMLAANEYFANEMNAYYDALSWKGHFWEKLPLAFNKFSSNHGQSWIRALIGTLVISLLFYCFFIMCLGYYPANPLKASSWKNLLIIASFYIDFLNPIHKLETFQSLYNDHELDPELRLIDGIGRIFITYCVYQLIQSFRKHGRSK